MTDRDPWTRTVEEGGTAAASRGRGQGEDLIEEANDVPAEVESEERARPCGEVTWTAQS